MKKTILIGLVSVVMTSSLLLAQAPAPTTPPATTPPPTAPTVTAPPSKAKVVTDMEEFEFGWIPSDAYVSHTYWFYSKGEDSLRILSVNPG